MGAQAWLLLLLPVVSATLPDQVLGMYVLLADDSDKVRATHWGGPKVGPYNSTADWTPQLHKYQQEGTNTLYFTFINPSLMPDVPPSFANLAKSRGKSTKGAVPAGSTEKQWQVDGLSGATLTTKGVDNLVRYWMGGQGFKPLLENLRRGEA